MSPRDLRELDVKQQLQTLFTPLQLAPLEHVFVIVYAVLFQAVAGDMHTSVATNVDSRKLRQLSEAGREIETMLLRDWQAEAYKQSLAVD